MTTADSTTRALRIKPAKPNPEFPLYAHAAGYWAKKIRGKVHYFGKWSEPDKALDKYLREKEALHAGKIPRSPGGEPTVKVIVNAFLHEKQAHVDTGELSARTWTEYKVVCDLIVKELGKQRLVADLGPDDFSELRSTMAKNWGPVRLGNMIQNVRCAFKFAYEGGLLAGPMRFGSGFKRPSKKTLRLHRAKRGPRMFSSADLRAILDAAGTPMKAMILLGINCGFGNADCATLPSRR
jgi:hypothetical protein